MKVMKYLFPILFIVLLAGGCNFSKDNSVQFDLVVLDTLRIPFAGDIHANTIPAQGKDGLFYVNGLKITNSGTILAKSIREEIGLLDENLTLIKKTRMPFPNGSLDLKRNQNAIEIYKNQLLLFHPGRDNKSPSF